uniref:protein-serine/threonine phosphatase n=1 Tax=Meloidogyne hapla TaxID=6305 RepID=A0A1I8BB73_MELHA
MESKATNLQLIRQIATWILNYNHLNGITDMEIGELIDNCKTFLEKEPSFIRVKAPVIIFSDIHGNFTDLLEFFRLLVPGMISLEEPKLNLLFLGDYVDRFNKLFKHLPLCALVNGCILCMHGGLPRIKNWNELAQVKKPKKIGDCYNDYDDSNAVVNDLLWADPTNNLESNNGMNSWFNDDRQTSIKFNDLYIREFMNRFPHIKGIVRGHEHVNSGYKLNADRTMCTLFTAPRYDRRTDSGCVMKGDFVWLDPTALGRNDSRQFNLQSSEFPAIAARVLSVWTDQQGGEHIILLDDQSNKLELGATEFQRWAIRPMHPTSIQGVSDLIQMVELHEAALLRNFQIRHRQNIYHTFIGNRILVSLNNLLEDGLPTDENQRKQLIRSYRQRPPHELLPHIYAFGAEILRFVKNGKNNCCVVFSGETASGKSESFKQLLTFLSADFANQNFETKLHSAQLIIEAFTNAKTSRNINASRHGKYLELNYTFNNEISQIIIASAKFELFFLEIHRVVEAFVVQSGES